VCGVSIGRLDYFRSHFDEKHVTCVFALKRREIRQIEFCNSFSWRFIHKDILAITMSDNHGYGQLTRKHTIMLLQIDIFLFDRCRNK
jgi:hypothetical protein